MWIERKVCKGQLVGGEIPGIYQVMKELKAQGYHLYCLTNWSHETFPIVREVHTRLFDMFEGIVVSGAEKQVKPNPEIYKILLNRYQLKPSESIFIDDRQANVDGAEKVGIKGVLFHGADNLRDQLSLLL